MPKTNEDILDRFYPSVIIIKNNDKKYLDEVAEFIKLNYNCPDSEKVGSGPGSCGGSSGNEHKNITMFPRSSNNKYENGLEFYARLWKVDPEIYDMIKEKVEGSPEYNLFNKLGDKWLRNIEPEAREDAISVVQNNKLLKSYLLHEQFGLDVPEKTTLYRVGRAKTGMTNSFFPNKQVAEAYQKRMGVESIYEYEVPTNEVIPSLSGAGEIWVPGDVESIIEKQNATYLADAFETIKLNYKCPKGTVDDSNKCNTENESLKNDDITVSNKNPIIIEKLTDEVIAALRYYTDEGYRNINHSLRHDGGESMTPEATEHMEWIDAMFEDKRAILTEGVVYRGYNSFELSQDDVVGSTIKDPAFVSVSNNESNANIFIDTAKFPVMAEIHIPDGSRGLAIPDSIATLPVGESEILLPRDSKFKITKSENKNGIKYITMDLITDRPIKTKQNSAYLDEVAEFIKLNYKCPKGTVDDSNKCNPEEQEKSNTSDSKHPSETFIGYKVKSLNDLSTKERLDLITFVDGGGIGNIYSNNLTDWQEALVSNQGNIPSIDKMIDIIARKMYRTPEEQKERDGTISQKTIDRYNKDIQRRKDEINDPKNTLYHDLKKVAENRIESIKNIDNIINRSIINYPIIVFSGIVPGIYGSTEIGKTFQVDTFLSTSTSENVAKGFADDKHDRIGPYIKSYNKNEPPTYLEIHLAAGSRALPIQEFVKNEFKKVKWLHGKSNIIDNQEEVIIGRKLLCEIVNIETDQSGRKKIVVNAKSNVL